MRSLPLILLALAPFGASAHAQTVAAIPALRELAPVKVWRGTPPVDPNWPGALPGRVVERTESTPGDRWSERLWNVSVPTYQPFLPAAGTGNGAAVIVAPGGGFYSLSVEKDGRAVALWLADRGIAAFVLRYRTMQRLPDESEEAMRKRINAKSGFSDSQKGDPAVADGLETLKRIRARASDYGIDPHRVGVVGFSAGGHVAGMMAIDADAKLRPDFAGLIYGMPFPEELPVLPSANLPYPPGTPVEPWLRPERAPAPGRLPPFFMAMAQDDYAVGRGFRQFYTALFDADYRPETHLYARGGHSFGMKPHGNTTDLWIQQFHAWMQSEGFLRQTPVK